MNTPTTETGVAILSESTDADGITTRISVGRVQSAADGTLDLIVYPWVKQTTPSGRVLRDELDTANPFPWALSSEESVALNASVKAAYDAAQTPPSEPQP